MILQRTLKEPVKATGVGLHSGERVCLLMSPAGPDAGIVFHRRDLPDSEDLQVHPYLVNDTRLSSTLVTDTGVRVGTIEHLMSALAALGIDNIHIDVTAPEIPIMDGSSAPFVFLLRDAGIIEQDVPKKFIRILNEVGITEGDKWVKLSPYDGFRVNISIFFNHPAFLLDTQSLNINFASTSYIDEICRARTFGFMHELEYMRSNGLGLGGSLDNAIVIDEEFVLNKEGLRYPDEFVRHKVLDAIGDLYVLGHPIIGEFSGYKPGHALNNRLIRKLVETPTAWEFVSFDKEAQVPSSFHRLPEVA